MDKYYLCGGCLNSHGYYCSPANKTKQPYGEVWKRQDKRDEQRHQESVKAQAVSFISKYYKDRGLIPLCAIATMYNDLFYYNREMYREFCCCTKEVQNRILEYCGLDLRVSEYSIYEKCLVAIESVLNKRFPDDKSVFTMEGSILLVA